MKEQPKGKLKLRFTIAMLIASAALPLIISALANAGAQGTARSQPRITRPRLRAVGSIDQLKEVFQHDTGKVRLVALVSPT